MRSGARVLGLLLSLVAGSAGAAFAQDRPLIELRPVVRATVRVVVLRGVDAVVSERETPRRARVAVSSGHGSGVCVGDSSTIVTARHVIDGTDAILVYAPGQEEGHIAQIRHVDPDHDLAVLDVDTGSGAGCEPIGLPNQHRSLQMSEPLSGSGYPLDATQRHPAAVVGTLSRLNNDGRLQLAMSVNPGNSGGPIIDRAGDLVGILVERGDTRRGVEGIAIVEPLSAVRRALMANVAPRRFNEEDRRRGEVLEGLLGAEEEGLDVTLPSPEEFARLASNARTPEETAILLSFAWSRYLAVLDANGAQAVASLAPGLRERATSLRGLLMPTARRLVERAPYILRYYPAVRAIVLGLDHVP